LGRSSQTAGRSSQNVGRCSQAAGRLGKMDDRTGGLWQRSAAADGCLSRDERFSAHAFAATGSPMGDRGYSFAGRVTVTGAAAHGQWISCGARTAVAVGTSRLSPCLFLQVAVWQITRAFVS
jgi:hypothetical protein